MKKNELIYADLSDRIIGCAFEVFNELGPGLLEKDYQKALRLSFRDARLNFREQVPHDVFYHETRVGRGDFDFMVEDKVVVELKRGKFNLNSELYQVLRYLRMCNIQLGLIIRFTPNGVEHKRVLNIPDDQQVA
ncbi:MAG TPA: GxxExxY protein [Bacteroidia bacterium]|nr:GxxExxY protein [Bacteroidia bacterium]